MFTPFAQEAAAPLLELALAPPTPELVEEQQAYVNLFLVVVGFPPTSPKVKIPLVEFPVAEPSIEALDAA